MQRFARILSALLLINLSLVGQEVACDHEALADHKAPMHDGSTPHHSELPTEEPPAPCDASSAQCCDALASCAIGAITGRDAEGDARPDMHVAFFADADSRRANAPVEVATPPPKA